jgi:hypothetical protein
LAPLTQYGNPIAIILLAVEPVVERPPHKLADHELDKCGQALVPRSTHDGLHLAHDAAVIVSPASTRS